MAVRRWGFVMLMAVAGLASAAMAVEEPTWKEVLHEVDFELRGFYSMNADTSKKTEKRQQVVVSKSPTSAIEQPDSGCD